MKTGGNELLAYDYFTINFTSVSGFIFLLIFLYANAALDRKIKRIFYIMLFVEFIEMLTYSLELWTTTFETLSQARLWLSAIGYSVRPIIFCLMLMLAARNVNDQHFPKVFYLPVIANIIAAFSVFFTDIVYSYTTDNIFQRGPLGYFTHIVTIIYLVILMTVVVKSHENHPKLEVLIIFAVSMLILFAMVIEAVYSIRTIGRSSIIMVTIFYYMFFQTRIHNESMTKEQSIRMQLEHANRMDGNTGVLNKKAFSDEMKKFLQEQNENTASRFGFVFLDLDHLKEINDKLGHSIGDIAISDVADTIRAVFRKTDLIGRFGGDEFCILLPNIPEQRFRCCLDEIQEKLKRKYSIDDTIVHVTASMGAVYVEGYIDLSYEQLIQMADEALYQAKKSGRNCHVIKEL